MGFRDSKSARWLAAAGLACLGLPCLAPLLFGSLSSSPGELSRQPRAIRGIEMRCHTRPRDHQRAALKFCKGRDYVGLIMEVGTGKTWVAENWLANDKDMLPALVLCRKDDIWTWLDEIKKHAPNTLGNPFIATPQRPRQRMKRSTRMQQQLRDNPNTPLWLANHDAAKTHYAQFARGPWKTLIIDESTDCIKRHNSDRTRKITSLGKRIPKRMIMTGTPITNKPADIFSQLRFLSPDLLGSSFYKFRICVASA